jgi:hypothetical protein
LQALGHFFNIQLNTFIAKDAREQSLQNTHQVFKNEAQCLDPAYTPATVKMDGWKATRNALEVIFSSVVIICCFLLV